MKLRLLVATFMFLGVISTPQCHSYSLSDALNGAMLNNKKIEIAKKDLDITLLKKPKAMTKFLPSVHAEFNRAIVKDKSDRGITGSERSFSLKATQNIYAGGGHIAQAAAADYEINAKYQEYISKLNEELLNVIKSYQDVLTSRKKVEVTLENIKASETQVQKARISMKSGAGTKTALAETEAAFAILKTQLEESKSQKIKAEEDFHHLVGVKMPDKNVESINLKNEHLLPSFESYVQSVLSNNPSLLSAKSLFKAHKYGLNVSYSKLLPQVDLYAEFDRGKRLNRAEPQNIYGIKMRVPLFYEGGENYIDVAEARKKSLRAELVIQETLNDIKAKVNASWNSYINSKSSYMESVKAKDSYYVAYQGLKMEVDAGARPITALPDQLRKYNDALMENLRLENALKVQYFYLHALEGKLQNLIK